ncbi:peptidyl-prolyl cis-trans isomerase [bacterium]|nr:peptidyl-prolyl cis-trans isomerase [bacterium]
MSGDVLHEIDAANSVVRLETGKGDIILELYDEKAPISVENFLRYVDEGFYSDTVFHRVIPNFMIQGGGLTADLQQKKTHSPIKNEAANGLGNSKGTIAMARTSVIDSATAQFFINVVDNPFLNYRAPTPEGFGYAVFGHVKSGMDVVEKIREVKTGTIGFHGDVPKEPVFIKSATILRRGGKAASENTSPSTPNQTTSSNQTTSGNPK